MTDNIERLTRVLNDLEEADGLGTLAATMKLAAALDARGVFARTVGSEDRPYGDDADVRSDNLNAIVRDNQGAVVGVFMSKAYTSGYNEGYDDGHRDADPNKLLPPEMGDMAIMSILSLDDDAAVFSDVHGFRVRIPRINWLQMGTPITIEVSKPKVVAS